VKKSKDSRVRAQLELPVFSDVAVSSSKVHRESSHVKFFTDEDKRRIKCMNSSSSKYAW